MSKNGTPNIFPNEVQTLVVDGSMAGYSLPRTIPLSMPIFLEGIIAIGKLETGSISSGILQAMDTLVVRGIVVHVRSVSFF